jgi:dihydropteroate synthase
VKVVALAGRPEDAIRHALLSYGWEGDLCRTTADGLESLAFHVTGVEQPTLEALVRTGARLGLDVVTGVDWALLSGPRSRLSALARPWTAPEPLTELAAALGHALPSDDPESWQTARGAIPLDRPVIIGIVNVTPDSFSDGGRHPTPGAALQHAERLQADGAGVLDIGGESTRPGAAPVPEQVERERVVPVISALCRNFPELPVSVDTTKSGVARAALDAGAAIVNDVSALRLDPAMAPLCADREAGVVLMHSRGSVATMASLDHAEFPDGVLPEVVGELQRALVRARDAGIPVGRLVADPGLGFGKTPEQNIELLRGLRTLRVLGVPLMVGPSRKRFLGHITGRPLGDRDIATAAACALAWEAGARLFRVHQPAVTRDALAISEAIRPR